MRGDCCLIRSLAFLGLLVYELVQYNICHSGRWENFNLCSQLMLMLYHYMFKATVLQGGDRRIHGKPNSRVRK